jgi:stage V sporulation protein G
MEITEVRIKLMADSDDRLQAFCSITFDNSFVVRDLKIIDGTSGPFVAMPSRKLTSHCHQCGSKNHLKAQFCNQCGARLREDRAVRDAEGRAKLYADIAHPINSQCREMIQSRVIVEYRTELEKAKQPGYMSRYDEDYDDDVDAATLVAQEPRQATGQPMAPAPAPQPFVPPPHMLPAAPPAGSPTSPGSTSAPGGPHFTSPPPQREPARATPDLASKKQPPRGDFGAGIF